MKHCTLFSSGFCDFEMDMCGWLNTRVSVSSIDWSWTSGTSDTLFAPEVDHTTNTAIGKYQHLLNTVCIRIMLLLCNYLI